MQTTVLLVELLVIGGQVILLVLPLLAWLLGISSSQLLSELDLKDLLVAITTLAYPAGLFWSRLGDVLFQRSDQRILKDYFSSREAYHIALVTIHLHSSALQERLAQVRSLFRIARASTLSFLVGSFIVPVAIIAEPANRHLGVLKPIGATMLMLACALASYRVWRHQRISYLNWAATAYRLLSNVAKADG